MSVETMGVRDLDWLRRVLWPDERVRVTVDGVLTQGFRRVVSYAIVPDARRPRLLVPLIPGAARMGFLQFNNSMSQRARLTKALAGAAFDLGIGRAMVRDRLHVDVSADVEPDEFPSVLLERHLADVLDLPDLTMSVTFGSLRPNRKPVLQLTSPARGLVGFAKVAWNGLTNALVRNEEVALRGWADRRPRTFLVPELVGHDSWHGREIVVASGFRSPVRRRGPRDGWPPPAVLREVAERDGIVRSALCSAPLWASVRRRIAALADASIVDRLSQMAEEFERRAGDTDVAVGSWHGDWAPWNMTWVGRRLAVWDWERSGPGVPLGLDPIHFAYQVSLRRAGRAPMVAVDEALPLATPALRAIGVGGTAADALLVLYLFELFLRYEDAAEEGVLANDDPVRAGTLEALSSTLRGGAR